MKKKIVSLFVMMAILLNIVPIVFAVENEIDTNYYKQDYYAQQQKEELETQLKKFEKEKEARELESIRRYEESQQYAEIWKYECEDVPVQLYSLTEFAGGNGSASNPYQISTPEQMAAISATSDNMKANYVLVNDIDFSDWGEWTPIGLIKNGYWSFQGTLDGKGYTIKNINIKSAIFGETYYTGIFMMSHNATFKNLNMENVTINISSDSKSTEYAGALTGSASGSIEVSNCKTSGNYAIDTVGHIEIGGLIGHVHNDADNNSLFKLQNCVSSCNVTATSSSGSISYGGIVGNVFSKGQMTISNCINNGNITADMNSCSIAGIIGSFSEYSSEDVAAVINNCTNNGNIKANMVSSANAAGITCNADDNTTISNCKNNGEIISISSTSSSSAGGIIESAEGRNINISKCSNNSRIYADIYNDDNYACSAGGIIGFLNHNSTCACVSDCTNSGEVEAETAGGIFGSVSGEMFTDSSETSCINCTNYATIIGKGGTGGIAGHFDMSLMSSCNNMGNVTLIASKLDNYSIGGIAGSNSGTISNCNNYGLVSLQVDDNVYGSDAGGIVGYNYDTIEYCTNNGMVIKTGEEGDDCHIGGIVGGSQDGSFVNYCYNYSDITVTNPEMVGGIAGTVDECIGSVNYGNININMNTNIRYSCEIGGIASRIYKKIIDCTNYGGINYIADEGSTSVNCDIGGICGFAYTENAEISNCNQNGELNINIKSILQSLHLCIGGIIGQGYNNMVSYENCVNVGNITANVADNSISNLKYPYVYIGGILGEADNDKSYISNCKNSGKIQSTPLEIGYVGGIVGGVSGSLEVGELCYYKSGTEAIGNYEEIKNRNKVTGYEKLIPLALSNTTTYTPSIVFNIKKYTEDGAVINEPVPNASVTFCGINKTSDSDGKVTFSKGEYSSSATGLYPLNIEADGCVTYSKDIILSRNMNISLIEKDPNKIYIADLTAGSVSGKSTNLLFKKLSLDKTDKSKYTLKLNMDWNGYEAGKVCLRAANSGKEYEFVNNELTIIPGKEFDINENVMIIAYTADKSKKAIKENLFNICALPDDVKLELPEVSSGDMSFIPFMENMEFTLGLDKDIKKYAAKASVEDNKLVLDFSAASVQKKTDNFKFFNSSKVEIGPYGKLEIPLDDIQNRDWSGTFGFKTKSSKKNEIDNVMVEFIEYNYNTMVVVGQVPIPVTASVAFKGGVKGQVKVDGKLRSPFFTGKVEPSVGAEVFGGLGHDFDSAEIKGGVYGELTGNLPVSYATENNKFDFDPSLEGSIGAKASVKVYIVDWEGQFEAGNFTWSKNGFEASWLGNKVKTMSLDDGWQLAGRDYLENGGGFVGDIPQIGLFDLDVSNKDERLVYENIFNNSEAILQNIDGKNYLIYTVDDADREQQNGLKLVYSTQNSDGTWSSPVAISDDGTLDSTVSASGKFAIWEDMKSQVSADNTNMSEILSQTEISVAQFDGNEWTSERLTDNSDFDFSPVISSNGDTAIAAWLSNSEADFSAQSGTTNLHYATYDGSAWSDVTTIEDIGKVTRVMVGYDGTNGNIFYKKDGSLYYVSITDNTETELGYSEVGQYTIGRYKGQTVLAYFDKDNNLQIITDVMGSKNQSSIEDDININSIPVIKTNGNDMYICWIDHKDGYDTLCGVRYENGQWSDKIAFVDDEANVSNPSLIINDDGTFTASYFKTGKAEVQDDGSYTTGATNLYINNIVPSYNLALNQETLTYNDEAYSKGGVAALTFDINNIGEKTVDGVNIEIYEGDELKQTIEKDITLKAGETQNVSVVYTPTEKNIVQDITLKVVPKKVDDFDISDNEGMIKLGAVDATVSSAYFTQEGGQYYVNAVFNNNGSVTADEINVQIHKDSVDGTIVYETATNDVLAKEELFIKEPVDVTEATANYFVTVSAANDVDEYNNFSMAVLDNSEPDLDFTVMEDNYNDDNSQLDLSIKTINNTETDKSVELIMAAYDMGGTLQKVINTKSTMQTGQNTIDASFDCADLSDDFTFKLFVWDSINGMQPIGSAFEKIINIAN